MPNGSTAGKEQLKIEEGQAHGQEGLHHILPLVVAATKTQGPSPPDAHVDYYAYALTRWAPMTGTNAGGTARTPVHTLAHNHEEHLSVQAGIHDMEDSHRCHGNHTRRRHTARVECTAPIVRFWPQTGSGTRSVYKTMFGFTPETLVGPTTTTSHGGLCGKTNKPITSFAHVTVTGVTQVGT